MFKKLEQGLGRLIRSRTDYGILTIFDSRIWNDPDICVDWGVDNPIVSERDKNAPKLCDSDIDFVYEV